MDDEGPGCGALGEAVVVLRVFEDLPDPRQRAKVVHPRDEILLLCLLAVLAGAGTITDMARFTTLEHSALTLTLTRTALGKHALRLRRKLAAWDDHFLHAVVTQ